MIRYLLAAAGLALVVKAVCVVLDVIGAAAAQAVPVNPTVPWP